MKKTKVKFTSQPYNHTLESHNMPLLLITGYPSAGKTTRAKQMQAFFEQKIKDTGSNLTVEVINDESLGLSKDSYNESRTEKMTRGEQISAVKRLLSKNTIVILDNMTYIKGFRYQLWCEAKAVATNYGVAHVGAPLDVCKQYNSKHPNPWNDELFDALVFRYEEPNGASKWDSPLFTIPHIDEDIAGEEMWNALVHRKVLKPNQATVLKPATSTDYLYELDKKTQAIVTEILDLQRDNVGGVIKLDGGKHQLQLSIDAVSLPELQRMRRQFVTLNKMRALGDDRIIPLFVDFVEKHLDE